MEKTPANRFPELEAYSERYTALTTLVDIDLLPQMQGKIVAKADELKRKYGADVEKYAMYNLLSGNTLPAGEVAEHFDFPEGDDVTHFIEELEKKYLKV